MAVANTSPLSSIYVKVDKSMQIVDGITPNTSVDEVILRLSNKTRRFRPQVLLEVWNGCTRRFQPHELILESLNKWGPSSRRTITLVMMDSDKYDGGFFLGLEDNKTRRKRRKRKSRVLTSNMNCSHTSYKLSYKRLPVHSTSKHKYLLRKELLVKIKNDLRHYLEERKRLNDIMTMANNSSATRQQEQPVNEIIRRLDPQMQAKYFTLTNDITQTTQSNDELMKHKKELRQTIINRQQEIATLQQKIDSTQKQVIYICTLFKWQLNLMYYLLTCLCLLSYI